MKRFSPRNLVLFLVHVFGFGIGACYSLLLFFCLFPMRVFKQPSNLGLLIAAVFGFGIGACYLIIPHCYLFSFSVQFLIVVLSLSRPSRFFLSGRAIKILPALFPTVWVASIFFETGFDGSRTWYGYGEFPNMFPHLYSRYLFVGFGCLIFFEIVLRFFDWYGSRELGILLVVYPLLLIYSFTFGITWYDARPPEFELPVGLLIGLGELELTLIEFAMNLVQAISYTFSVGLLYFTLISLLMVPLFLVEKEKLEACFSLPVFSTFCFSSLLFLATFRSGTFAIDSERQGYPDFVPHVNQDLIGITLLVLFAYILFSYFSLYGEKVYRNYATNYEVRESFGWFFFSCWCFFCSAIFVSAGQLEAIFSAYKLYEVTVPPAYQTLHSTVPLLAAALAESSRLNFYFSVFPLVELIILISVLAGTGYGYYSVPLKLNALVWDRRVFMFLIQALIFFSISPFLR